MYQYRVVLCLLKSRTGLSTSYSVFINFNARSTACSVSPATMANHISDKTQSPVNNSPVIGTGFRIGLPCLGKTARRGILPCQHTCNAGDGRRPFCIYCLNQRMGMGASQDFYHQAVFRRQIIPYKPAPPSQEPWHPFFITARFTFFSRFMISAPPVSLSPVFLPPVFRRLRGIF